MAKKDNLPVKKNPVGQMKETRCIYIPGQPVKNIMPGCDYKIVLGSVREVIFNFNVRLFTSITIEIIKYSSSTDIRDYGVFDLKTKKHIREYFFVKSGEPYRVHVSRFFKGTFVVKANGKVLGMYTPMDMDSKRYGLEPELWIEPLYIGFNEVVHHDPMGSIINYHKQSSYDWLKNLPQFKYKTPQNSFIPQDIKTSFVEISNIPKAKHGIVFIYKAKKDRPITWRDVDQHEITVRELESRLEKTDWEEFRRVIMPLLTSPEAASAFGGTDFTIKNRHWSDFLFRKLQMKWIKNGRDSYLAICFKGYNRPFNKTTTGLGNDVVKSFTGGVHIKKSHRIWATFKEASKVSSVAKGMKGLPAVGLIIDLIGDYNTVMMDEKGSKDIAELLGRAGVSIVAAGVGTVASTLVLATLMKGFLFVGTTIPIGVVLLIGALLVVATAYLISKGSGKVKDAIFQ